MALCHVTGTVYLPDGSVAARREVVFYKLPDNVTADYLGAVVPEPIATRTDNDGAIDVNLITGNYHGYTLDRNGNNRYMFRAVVPELAAADFSDLIDAVAPVEPLPAWLQQAIEARDEAREAADEAVAIVGDLGDLEDAVERAEIAASNAAADANAQIAPNVAAAEDAKNVAVGAKVDAESARDAAFINANVYPDVATGRAAVADGGQFQVVNGDEIIRYRRDSASTQTEVGRYPAAALVDRVLGTVLGVVPLGHKTWPPPYGAQAPGVTYVLMDAAPVGARRLDAVDFYTAVAMTVEVGVWRNISGTLTRLSVVAVAASVGFNSPKINLPMAPGDFLGLSFPVAGAGTATASTETVGYWFGSPGVSAFEPVNPNTSVRLMIRGRVVASEGEGSLTGRLARLEDRLTNAEFIGYPSGVALPTAGGTEAGAAQYVFMTPTGDGALAVEGIEVRALVAGQVRVSVWRRATGNDFNRIHMQAADVAVGLNNVAISIPTAPGDLLAVSPSLNGAVAFTTGADNLTPVYSAGSATTFNTDTTTKLLNISLQARLRVRADEAVQNLQERVADLESANSSAAQTQWSGKSFVFQGDSITDAGASTWPTRFLAEIGGTLSQNAANSGRRSVDNLKRKNGENFDETDFVSVDCVILYMGQNDASNPIGTIADAITAATFYGYTKKFIEQVLTWNPQVRIVLVTQINLTRTVALSGISQAMRDLGALYSLPVVDLERVSGFNAINKTTYFLDDLHPNDAFGEPALAKTFAAAFRAIGPIT